MQDWLPFTQFLIENHDRLLKKKRMETRISYKIVRKIWFQTISSKKFTRIHLHQRD